MGQKPCCSISPISSAVYNTNKIGSSTEPRGTPQTRSTKGDFSMPRRTYCERPWR